METSFTVHKPSVNVFSVIYYHGHLCCGTSNLEEKAIVKFTFGTKTLGCLPSY